MIGGKKQKGMILIITMAFVMLMTLSMISFTSILKRDMDLIERVKVAEQARNIAAAGLSHALAVVRYDVEEIADLSQVDGELDTGAYTVTFGDPVEIEGVDEVKYCVISTGTVTGSDVSKTLYAEIRLPPTTAGYHMAAAGNVRIYAPSTWWLWQQPITIKGNIHANCNVSIMGAWVANLFDWPTLMTNISGAEGESAAMVSARNSEVREGIRHNLSDLFDTGVYINGINSDMATVFEGNRDAPMIHLPTISWGQYKSAAQNGGIYSGSDRTYDNQELSPGNGIVYVKGRVLFKGDCVLNGGIVATRGITIDRRATLVQKDTDHNRNVIIAKAGDISIGGTLRNVTLADVAGGSTGDEAVFVYAGGDIRFTGFSRVQLAIQGSLVAKGDIDLQALFAGIGYVYKYVHPEDVNLHATDVEFSE